MAALSTCGLSKSSGVDRALRRMPAFEPPPVTILRSGTRCGLIGETPKLMTINLQTTGSMLSCVALGLTTLLGGFHPATAGESELQTRLTRYWTLRQEKDLGAMYEMYSTAYRSKVSRSEFLKLTRLIRFDITSFQVEPPHPVDGRADVSIAYRFKVLLKQSDTEVESRATETWVQEPDGVWYKLDEPLVLPFPTSPSEPSRSGGSTERAR